MIEQILVLLNPNFWFMNYDYDHNWDKKLNSLLNSKDFTNIDKYTAKIGEYTVWVENYPYACFKCIGGEKIYSGRPSRYTIYKSYKKLLIDKMPIKDRISTRRNDKLKKHFLIELVNQVRKIKVLVMKNI